jgi:hypothetical protein
MKIMKGDEISPEKINRGIGRRRQICSKIWEEHNRKK